jgi:hypothetical protein
MTGYLTKIIDRQLRRITLATVIGIAVVTTTALAISRFHDPKFDEADIAVEKAQILLNAAACGVPGEKTTEACDRLMKRAQELLAKARDAITAAAITADGGDVELRR